MRVDFYKCINYRLLPTPVVVGDITILGVFGYETARVTVPMEQRLKMPRSVAASIEDALPSGYSDNKIVVICKDNINFGTRSFAVQLHDSGCVFGSWGSVTGYGGEPLKEIWW